MSLNDDDVQIWPNLQAQGLKFGAQHEFLALALDADAERAAMKTATMLTTVPQPWQKRKSSPQRSHLRDEVYLDVWNTPGSSIARSSFPPVSGLQLHIGCFWALYILVEVHALVSVCFLPAEAGIGCLSLIGRGCIWFRVISDRDTRMNYCLCITGKPKQNTGGQHMFDASIDQLIAVFQRWRSDADARLAKSGTADPALPRVPYKVQQIASSDDQVIAHFHRHYKKPSEVIGTLTLKRPDLSGGKDKRK